MDAGSLSERAMLKRIEFCMTFDAALTRKIERAAEARKKLPADLVEKIIEVVVGDDIIDAVLDETVT